MANISILVSSVVCAALAAPASGIRNKFLRNLFRGKRTPLKVVAPVILQRPTGWQLIQCDDPVSFGEWLDRDQVGMPPKAGEEGSLGSHLLIEMFDCDRDSLKTVQSVGNAMLNAAEESEATIVTDSFHEFKPYGVSGAVIIQESHYTIHTWPEHGYAAVDLFYCGGTIKVHQAIDILRARFQPGRMKFLVVRRGLESEV